MAYLSFDSLTDYLENLGTEKSITSPLNDQIQELKLELRFLSTFLRCTSLGFIKDEGENLPGILTRIDGFVEEAEMKLLVTATNDLSCKIPVLLEAIKLIHPEIRSVFLKELEVQPEAKNIPDYETVLELIDRLSRNLKALVNGKANSVVTLKKHIEALQESLGFLGSVIQFAENRCTGHYNILKDLLTHVGAVIQRATRLSCMCWVDELVDEETVDGICVRLSDLLQKIKPTTNPETREIYSAVVKVPKLPPPDIAMNKEFVVAFTGSLIENLRELQDIEYWSTLTVPPEVHIQITLQELKFLRGLVIDLQYQNVKPQELDNFLVEIENVVCEAGSVVYIVCAIVQQEDVAKEMNLVFLDFVKRIRQIKEDGRRIYLGKLQDNPSGNCDILFIDQIRGYLKDLPKYRNKSAATAIQQIKTLLEGLSFLSTFFKEQGELKYAYLRFINTVYRADYAVKCFVSRGGPVWHHLICSVMEEIKTMKTELIDAYAMKNSDAEVLKDSQISINPAGQIYFAPSYSADNTADFSGGNVALDDAAISPSYLRNTVDSNENGVDFDGVRKTIIHHLTRGPKELQIVSIVGMPGAGKTFLAKRIYNDHSVRSYFHCLSWAVVSQEYELRNLLLSILTTISNSSSYIYEMDDDDLCVKVRQSLLRKKYLVVLDDVWDFGFWNEIKWLFPDDKNGSRILLTTRYNNLGLDANAYYMHSIPLLNIEESLKLLELKLFHGKGFPADLLEIGNRIVKDCQGLPLSLVTIAGVLATIGYEVDKWKQVAETLNTRYYNDKFVILEMSYRHLPYHLKLAYLYSSGISQDNVIPVQKLIWLWIAEGLVEKTEEVKSLEDLAEDCLNDLIDRSLLMVTKRKSNGRVKECRVHDLLLEFCKTKAKEINCLDVIHGHQEIASFVASSRHRHRLCISSEWQHFIERKSWSPYLRSLLFFSTNKTQKTQSYDVSSVCYDFKLLTVLDLGCINMGNAFPSRIELLLHLRFLAVKGEVNVLPSYIGNFQSLETLIIEGLGGEIFLPETIWELEMLRHLHISPRVAFGLQEYKNGNRHLANLSTFSTPALPHGKCMEKIMRRLPNIRKLKCIFLESLDYLWFPIFDFLSQLESLKVSYLGVTPYSCKLDFPLNLKELTLSKFRLPWNEISVIGRLPNLEVLKLLTQSFDGQQWNMKDGEFLKLRFLKLAELNIVRWNAFYDHLPVLQHLVLEKCEQLQEIPADFGDSTSLDKIEVQYCSDSAVISAEKILEEQLEMGNEMLKVLIYP